MWDIFQGSRKVMQLSKKKNGDFLAIHKGKETRRTLLVERERERAKSQWSGKGKSLALFTQTQ